MLKRWTIWQRRLLIRPSRSLRVSKRIRDINFWFSVLLDKISVRVLELEADNFGMKIQMMWRGSATSTIPISVWSQPLRYIYIELKFVTTFLTFIEFWKKCLKIKVLCFFSIELDVWEKQMLTYSQKSGFICENRLLFFHLEKNSEKLFDFYE